MKNISNRSIVSASFRLTKRACIERARRVDPIHFNRMKLGYKSPVEWSFWVCMCHRLDIWPHLEWYSQITQLAEVSYGLLTNITDDHHRIVFFFVFQSQQCIIFRIFSVKSFVHTIFAFGLC